MKKILFTLGCFLGFCIANAQVQMPKASPAEFIRQEFGLGTIELNYSRPGVKGRDMIGVVEPWDSVWRTGANDATQIKFSDTVLIDGKQINPGTYAIYTIPTKSGKWYFILNNGKDTRGAFAYNQDYDIVRMQVTAGKNKQKVETFTMQFSDVKPESIALNLKWEDFSLKIPITTQIKERIRNAIEREMKNEKKPYWQAATFYYEYDKNYSKALEMANAAFSEMENPPYYMIFYKARIQKDGGDRKGALETAKKALSSAEAARNKNYIVLSKLMINELR